ncbi:hypothetical protein CMI37_23230 [Candidatus Pacearchaeota archaeon]|nr:hypothetical protein [Candidatus Pacearchaeota archaeon]|tara:strand:+ start:2098 stop:2724 length:627 start_codon:yes stop_codon:yes gene_type:complete
MSYLKSEHLTTTTYPGLVIEPMLGKDWQPVLNLALKILGESGFEYQLGSGTLLGMVREKDGFIHHDTDLDIDIIERGEDNYISSLSERLETVVASFLDKGFKLVRTQFYIGLPMQVAFIYKENNLIVDLCFFYKKWGSDYCNIHEHGVYLRPDYSVDEVVLFEFNKGEYKIPKEYDTYLKGRYGADWKTPKKQKKSGEYDAGEYLIVL